MNLSFLHSQTLSVQLITPLFITLTVQVSKRYCFFLANTVAQKNSFCSQHCELKSIHVLGFQILDWDITKIF